MKTITQISRLDGRVYVYLASKQLVCQSLKQAEIEGFTFCDGVNPTNSKETAVMAVNPNRTINFVGFVGLMPYAVAETIGDKRIIRVEYTGKSLETDSKTVCLIYSHYDKKMLFYRAQARETFLVGERGIFVARSGNTESC